MNDTMIPTGVPDTAAARLTARRASTNTADHLTAVWSTLPVTCTAGRDGAPGHLTWAMPADQVPQVWDLTGSGDWILLAMMQCPSCGQQVGPRAALRHGWLSEDAAGIAAQIAEETEADHDAATVAIVERLREELAEAAAAIRAQGYDPTSITRDELRALDVPHLGSETEPGIYLDTVLDDQPGAIDAWAYDPCGDGETIVVSITEVTR